MKKWLLSFFAFLLLLTNVASADQWEDAGRNIGQHIGSVVAGGNDNKAFWYAKDYDFANIKTIVVNTSVSLSVSDPYLKYKYIDVLAEKFDNTNIKFLDQSVLYNEYTALLQKNNVTPEQYNFLYYVYDAYQTTTYMQVNIYAYNNRPYPGIRTMGDCWLDFKIMDVRRYQAGQPDSIDILFYNDQRLDAVNASKGGLLNRITGRFKNKFGDALEKKAITE